MVPFLNLKEITARDRSKLLAAAARVIDSCWFILGSEHEAFEQGFAAFHGDCKAIGVANGLDALPLRLSAIGLDSWSQHSLALSSLIACFRL